MAFTILAAVFLPVSGLAVTQRVAHNYKTKAPNREHLKMGKHTNVHGKQFASSVKEHGRQAKALREKAANDRFGVHRIK